MVFLPLSLPIPKPMQTQWNEWDCRLARRLTIAEYHIEEPKPILSVLSRRYSISHSTLSRYTGEDKKSVCQYKRTRLSKQ